MAWLYLVAAGLFEVAWVAGFKFIGPARPVTSAATMAAMGASFWLLWLAMRSLPVGTAYAVWVGIGAAGAAIVGILLFKEPLSLARVFCIGLIVAGVIGLKVTA